LSTLPFKLLNHGLSGWIQPAHVAASFDPVQAHDALEPKPAPAQLPEFAAFHRNNTFTSVL
jgi:hypothetical protein